GRPVPGRSPRPGCAVNGSGALRVRSGGRGLSPEFVSSTSLPKRGRGRSAAPWVRESLRDRDLRSVQLHPRRGLPWVRWLRGDGYDQTPSSGTSDPSTQDGPVFDHPFTGPLEFTGYHSRRAAPRRRTIGWVVLPRSVPLPRARIASGKKLRW